MEHDFHKWLRDHESVSQPVENLLIGIGDDAAVIRGSEMHTVVTTDTIAEGTHFDTSVHSLELIGRKSLAVNLSDIAAMGASPTHALVTLLLPNHFSITDAKRLCSGIFEIASNYNVSIVGGDTNKWAGKLVVGVTLMGQRSPSTTGWNLNGAQLSDRVIVSGSFGGSILGRHLSFEPRIDLSNYLAQRYQIHGATDASDSLSLDLQLLAQASGVGIDLTADNIPISDALKTADPQAQLDGALFDGEDFELILTIAPDVYEQIKADPMIPCPLTDIGTVTEEQSGLRIFNSQGVFQTLSPRGYVH
ncbi:MAG: thiamine-phosphate kinase [Mariniblastus sp.]|nr:thiamine-phosphate kinase [Mariniblastus sp.]